MFSKYITMRFISLLSYSVVSLAVLNLTWNEAYHWRAIA